MVFPRRVCHMHPPRTGCVDLKVGNSIYHPAAAIPEGFFVRIYAVTIRNLPITIGFAAITTSQVVVGIWMTVLGSERSGVIPILNQNDHPHSECLSDPWRWRLRRHTTPADTSGRIQLVCVQQA